MKPALTAAIGSPRPLKKRRRTIWRDSDATSRAQAVARHLENDDPTALLVIDQHQAEWPLAKVDTGAGQLNVRRTIPLIIKSGLFGGTPWGVTIEELELNRQRSIASGKRVEGFACAP